MTQKILVPLDLTQDAATELALPEAIAMAQQRDAQLYLMTVLIDLASGMYPAIPRFSPDEARQQSLRRLEEIGQSMIPDTIEWQADVVTGRVPHTIVSEAERLDVNLIVMAAHDPSFGDLLLGSVADNVMRRAHCSMLVVRDPASRNQ